MVLDKSMRERIVEYVMLQPRSIQEIALFIGKNWRTADSYVTRISEELGLLQTKTFREGTRGALKIVYHQSLEKMSRTGIREKLFSKAITARHRNDFRPFDIYQYVDEDKRNAFMEKQSEYAITKKQDLVGALRKANHQVIIFSGNLSWSAASQEKEKLLDVLEELMERDVKIKIVANVNFDSIVNIKKALALNYKLKKELLEIRHSWQPFRAFIVDDEFVRFKEEGYFNKEEKGKKQAFMFYEIFDSDWIAWTQQIFWHLFNNSINANKRLEDLESVKVICQE